jgi:hypothetical protein
VLTLGLINAGPILKMTQSTMERMLQADFSKYAEMCGLPRNVVVRKALRNALPSIVTIVSVLYGFLIGGAVLVEIVFSWGGAGQYAVQGVLNADLNPVLGFVSLFGHSFAGHLSDRRSHLLRHRSEDALMADARRPRPPQREGRIGWRSASRDPGLTVAFPHYGARAVPALSRSISASRWRGARARRGIGSGKTMLARSIMQLVPEPGRIEQRPGVVRGAAT